MCFKPLKKNPIFLNKCNGKKLINYHTDWPFWVWVRPFTAFFRWDPSLSEQRDRHSSPVFPIHISNNIFSMQIGEYCIWFAFTLTTNWHMQNPDKWMKNNQGKYWLNLRTYLQKTPQWLLLNMGTGVPMSISICLHAASVNKSFEKQRTINCTTYKGATL